MYRLQKSILSTATHLKALKAFPSACRTPLATNTRLFSTKVDSSNSKSVFTPIEEVNNKTINNFLQNPNPLDDYGLKYSFSDNFDMSSVSKAGSLYDVRDGGYVHFTEEELAKYLPEGFPGEMKEEFELSKTHSIMIREANKLLCRIIDESSHKAIDNSERFVNRLSWSLFTNRPEWDNCQLKVYNYGKEAKVKEPLVPSPVVPVRGPQARYEKIFNMVRSKDEHKALPKKIMITGQRGTGKSFALAHSVYHARKNGWLALFIPNAWDHVQSGSFIEPYEYDLPVSSQPVSSKGQLIDKITGQPTDTLPTIYDNTFMSLSTLRSFWKAHSTQLAKIPLKDASAVMKKYEEYLTLFRIEYDRSRSLKGREKLNFIETRRIMQQEDNIPEEDEQDFEMLENYNFQQHKVETVKDLVELGIAFYDLAGAVFIDMVEELKQIKDVPVLIAVDHYNTWSVPSVYSYKQKQIHSLQLCVPYALSFISKVKELNESPNYVLQNGLFLCATSARYSEGRNVNFLAAARSIPLLLHMPNYSQSEYMSAMSYYVQQRIIYSCLTKQEFLSYRTYTGSNPRNLRVNRFYLSEKAIEKDLKVDRETIDTEDGVEGLGLMDHEEDDNRFDDVKRYYAFLRSHEERMSNRDSDVAASSEAVVVEEDAEDTNSLSNEIQQLLAQDEVKAISIDNIDLNSVPVPEVEAAPLIDCIIDGAEELTAQQLEQLLSEADLEVELEMNPEATAIEEEEEDLLAGLSKKDQQEAVQSLQAFFKSLSTEELDELFEDEDLEGFKHFMDSGLTAAPVQLSEIEQLRAQPTSTTGDDAATAAAEK